MGLSQHLWLVRNAYRKVFPSQGEQPDWPQLLGQDFERWTALREALPADAPRVLLLSSHGSPWVTNIDSVLAVAFALRGVRAHVLLCDETLPACQQSTRELLPSEDEMLSHGPRRVLCGPCHRPADRMYRDLGVPVESLGTYVTPEERAEAVAIAQKVTAEEVPGVTLAGYRVGEHAMAGAIRFFARGRLNDEPNGEAVLRRYLQAAIIVARGADRLMKKHRFLCVSGHHGIYVPQGVIGEVARKSGSRFVAWQVAYRKGRFVFSHDDTYHHTMMNEPTGSWENLDLGPEREGELVDYLNSRGSGTADWIAFNRGASGDIDAASREVGIDFSKPTIGLLTNVLWDAALYYPQNAFKDMLEWIAMTIRYFQKRPDMQLLIRVHPAELTGLVPSRQPVIGEIMRLFEKLPDNVFIIPPESKVNTYACMMKCDSVLIYGTKTGAELSSFGVPIIVAGEAWIRNKGVTTDITSPEHYIQVLDRLPLGKRMAAPAVRRARQYAYHFFFRRMIPIEALGPAPAGRNCPYQVAIQGLDNLRPGRNLGLDTICRGIMERSDFIYPAELVDVPAKAAASASG